MSINTTNATLAMDRPHAASLVAGTPLRVIEQAPARAGEACTLLNLPEWARTNTAFTTEDGTRSTVLDRDDEMLVEFLDGSTGYVRIERLTLASEQEPVTATLTPIDVEGALTAQRDTARAEVASLRETVGNLITERDRATSATRFAEDHLERVRLALIAEGERRDWCGELDDFLLANDLAPRERTEEVTLTVTLTVQVTTVQEVTWTGGDTEREQAVEEVIDNLDADTLLRGFNQWRDTATVDSADEDR
jgi:hypothetical protein